MLSPGVAALIAHVAFWFLLAYGRFWDEVTPRGATILAALWLTGWFALPFVPYGAALFPSYVAVLDIVLVWIIFKGDVRLG